MYRRRANLLEVLLVHPGGPYSAGKDEDHWSIPKGEIRPGEDLLVTAQREFAEEVGLQAEGPFTALGSIRQKSGKIVHAWACEGDIDLARHFHSNTFHLEWPPGSRIIREFPEIDRAEFFQLDKARRKLKAAQGPFLDRLRRHLEQPSSEPPVPAQMPPRETQSC
jgi:predicted NUDIX family NTP pyrophosphohydrolase